MIKISRYIVPYKIKAEILFDEVYRTAPISQIKYRTVT